MSYKSLVGLGVFFMNKIGVTQTKSAIKPRNLSGPIGLATMLFKSVQTGSIRFGLYFVVLVSFALAIFNLLPLPVLDGGHITFALIEIITGKPLHDTVIKILTVIFIFLLVTLMIYVTYFDILRRLPKSVQEKLDPDNLTAKTEKTSSTVENNNAEKTPVKTD
jgi:RIP metalloprotease RseP